MKIKKYPLTQKKIYSFNNIINSQLMEQSLLQLAHLIPISKELFKINISQLIIITSLIIKIQQHLTDVICKQHLELAFIITQVENQILFAYTLNIWNKLWTGKSTKRRGILRREITIHFLTLRGCIYLYTNLNKFTRDQMRRQSMFSTPWTPWLMLKILPFDIYPMRKSQLII